MGPIDPKSHRSSSRRVAGRLLHCCGKNLSYRLLSSRFVTRLSDASHFLAGYGNVSCKRLVASIFFEPKYFERIVIVLDSSGTCRRNVSKLATADGLNQSSNPTGSRDRCEPIAKLVEIQPTSFSTPKLAFLLWSPGLACVWSAARTEFPKAGWPQLVETWVWTIGRFWSRCTGTAYNKRDGPRVMERVISFFP